MNARIRKFERESGLEIYGLGARRDKWEHCVEKFAKLIVQECISVVSRRAVGDHNREDAEVEWWTESVPIAGRVYGMDVVRSIIAKALAWQAEQIVAMLDRRSSDAFNTFSAEISDYYEGRMDEAKEAAQAVRDMTGENGND